MLSQMENLTLQLRVVRHMQNVDKEKMMVQTNEIDGMKSEISFLTEDNKKSHSVSLLFKELRQNFSL
jgi:hypothetical protein